MARPKSKNAKRDALKIEASKVKNREQAKRLSQKSLQSAYENQISEVRKKTDVCLKSTFVATVVTSSSWGGVVIFLCSCRRRSKLHVGTIGVNVALMCKAQEARQSTHFFCVTDFPPWPSYLGVRRSSNSRQKVEGFPVYKNWGSTRSCFRPFCLKSVKNKV